MIKVLDLPYGKFRDKGQPIDNVSNYDSSQETCLFLAPLGAIMEQKLLFGTASGMIKLVSGREFDVSKRTTAATKLADGDELIFVQALAQESGAETLQTQPQKAQEVFAMQLQNKGEAFTMQPEKAQEASTMQLEKTQEASTMQLEKAQEAFTMQPQKSQDTSAAQLQKGQETLVMQSQKGMFLRIEAACIPEKKKTAIGVRGIRLAENDRLTHMYLLGKQDGLVKAEYEPSEVVLNRLRIGARDTKGVKR